MKVILKSKKNQHYAVGEYDGNGIRVLKDSRINLTDSYLEMSSAVKAHRHNPEYVTETGVLIQDIYFSSPSTAAVFVTGRSVNGYIAWRVDDRISLKRFRQESTDNN